MKTTKITYKVKDENEILHIFSIKTKGNFASDFSGERPSRSIKCHCGTRHVMHKGNPLVLVRSSMKNYGEFLDLKTGDLAKRTFPGGS